MAYFKKFDTRRSQRRTRGMGRLEIHAGLQNPLMELPTHDLYGTSPWLEFIADSTP